MTDAEAREEALKVLKQVYKQELTPEAAMVLFESMAEEIPK